MSICNVHLLPHVICRQKLSNSITYLLPLFFSSPFYFCFWAFIYFFLSELLHNIAYLPLRLFTSKNCNGSWILCLFCYSINTTRQTMYIIQGHSEEKLMILTQTDTTTMNRILCVLTQYTSLSGLSHWMHGFLWLPTTQPLLKLDKKFTFIPRQCSVFFTFLMHAHQTFPDLRNVNLHNFSK